MGDGDPRCCRRRDAPGARCLGSRRHRSVAGAEHRAWTAPVPVPSASYCHPCPGAGSRLSRSRRRSASRLALGAACSAVHLAGVCGVGLGACAPPPYSRSLLLQGLLRAPSRGGSPLPWKQSHLGRRHRPSVRELLSPPHPPGYVPVLSQSRRGKWPRGEGSFSHRVIVFAEPCAAMHGDPVYPRVVLFLC